VSNSVLNREKALLKNQKGLFVWISYSIIILCFVSISAVQEGHHLGTRAFRIGAELVVAGAKGNFIFHCPSHGVSVETVCCDIVKTGIAADCRRRCCTIQECCHLASRAFGIRRERCLTGTKGYTLLNRPKNCLIVIVTLVYICKLIVGDSGFRASGCTPQEGYHLTSCAACIGGKCIFADTHRDFILNCPKNGIAIVIFFRHINKRIFHFLFSRRGRRCGGCRRNRSAAKRYNNSLGHLRVVFVCTCFVNIVCSDGIRNFDLTCALCSDGFDALQEKLAWTESLVLITPVYWSESNEAMKVFMDRVRRCEGSKAFYGGSKEGSLLYQKPCVMAACAGGTGNGTISTLDQMNRFVQHCGGRFYDHIGLNRWTFDYKKKAFEEAVYSMLS